MILPIEAKHQPPENDMNEVMKSAIDTCDALTDTKREFISAVKKATGLTATGINRLEYVQKIIAKKSA